MRVVVVVVSGSGGRRMRSEERGEELTDGGRLLSLI